MLRILAASVRLSLLIAVALPASASAAPLVELPFQRAPAGTGCQAPTGSPGELSRWAEGGAAVLSAGPGGLGRPALVALGELPGCPRVAANASGAAVAAGSTKDALRVALREPGSGSFGAPVTLAAARDVFDLSVAVSPRGDAVVAWAEWSSRRQVRVQVARREAGAAFGAPTELVPWRQATGGAVLAGMAADGESVVVVREPVGTAKHPESVDTVRFGARGAPLGPPTVLPRQVYVLALGVAPSGRVVLGATSSSGSVDVIERPAGGVLGAPQPLTDPLVPADAEQMSIAFGADDRTVLAWHDPGYGTTGAAIRDGATGFGAPVVIVPPPKERGFGGAGAGLPIVPPLPALQSAVAPDGRVSVAWPGGDLRLATIAGNTVVERQRLGSRLRVPDGLSLLTLADGRRAVAWRNQDRWFDHAPPVRVHYAIEGAPPTPERAAPRVTVGQPRERALRPGQSLALPVRCTAACDLKVTLTAESGGSTAERSLTRAGAVTMRLGPPGRAIAPARPGPVRIVVQSSAPGARAITRTIARPRLRRLPALPLPRIQAVRARRLSGGRVEVRWRMSSDARETLLAVIGTRTRTESRDDDPAIDALWGQRRRDYRVVLEEAADKRWVHVEVTQLVSERERSVAVRIP